MSTITELLDPETSEHIEHELHMCRETQSWAPGSTRSSWVGELQAILDASTPSEVAAAIAAAKAEQRRLATKVAHRLIDPDALRDRLNRETDDDAVLDELGDAETVADLIALARTHDLLIDEASLGESDGWQIGSDYATVYASMRPLLGEDDYDFVELEVEGAA